MEKEAKAKLPGPDARDGIKRVLFIAAGPFLFFSGDKEAGSFRGALVGTESISAVGGGEQRRRRAVCNMGATWRRRVVFTGMTKLLFL